MRGHQPPPHPQGPAQALPQAVPHTGAVQSAAATAGQAGAQPNQPAKQGSPWVRKLASAPHRRMSWDTATPPETGTGGGKAMISVFSKGVGTPRPGLTS